MQLGLFEGLNQLLFVLFVAVLGGFLQVGATFTTELLGECDGLAALVARFGEMVAATLAKFCVCSIFGFAVSTGIARCLSDFLWRTHCVSVVVPYS